MKKFLFPLICFFFTGIGAFAQLIDKPAATVTLTQPEYISVRQLEEQLTQFAILRSQGITGLPSDPMEVLDALIQEILLKQAAADSKVRISDAEVDTYIARVKASADLQRQSVGEEPYTDQKFREIVFQQTGLSWDAYRESIRDQQSTIAYVRVAKADLFAAVPVPSDTEVEKYFRKNATSFIDPEVVRFSEIFISTEDLNASEKRKARERADAVLRAFENGEGSFTQLVEQHSDDTKARYSGTGGDKGYFSRNDVRTIAYGEEFIDKLFDLEVGEVSGVIESRKGYHIVKITEHLDPRLLQLDDPKSPGSTQTVREFIRSALKDQQEQVVFQQALRELVEELKKDADIKIYEENITS